MRSARPGAGRSAPAAAAAARLRQASLISSVISSSGRRSSGGGRGRSCPSAGRRRPFAPGGTLVSYGSASTCDDEGSKQWPVLKLLGRVWLWNTLPDGRHACFYNVRGGRAPEPGPLPGPAAHRPHPRPRSPAPRRDHRPDRRRTAPHPGRRGHATGRVRHRRRKGRPACLTQTAHTAPFPARLLPVAPPPLPATSPAQCGRAATASARSPAPPARQRRRRLVRLFPARRHGRGGAGLPK
jgi:hypothetical protein